MRTVWEYKFVNQPNYRENPQKDVVTREQILAPLGADGWELVAAADGFYILKRPKAQ